MIIPMKKVTLLCLAQERVSTLDQLRRLGLMQLEQEKLPETVDVASLTKESADAEKAINMIQMAVTKEKLSLHSYNANGGSGAPSSQTKYYGVTLVLSSTKPTRTGYTFQGWGASASATTASYQAGANYTTNASATLYAVWKANTYTVSYNANGGSGAPASQTKTHGVALTLSSTKPTRTNYTFKGWGTSASATTAAYASGASYTTNANTTLYAVWELAYSEPTVTNFKAFRCTSAGTADDFGTYAKVTFSWSCDQTLGSNAIKSIAIAYKLTTATSWTSSTVTASGTSGSVSQVIGGGALSVDNAYDIKITVTDSKDGTTTMTKTIGGASFPIDFLAGGKGVAIGKPATKENALDVGFPAYFGDAIYDQHGYEFHNGLSAYSPAADGVIDPNTTSEELVLTNHANGPISGTFFYIRTVWYGGKSTSSYRAQHAVPYNSAKSMYHRYYNGSWSAWIRSATESDIYTHPTTSGNKHIPSGGSQGQFLGWYADGTASWRNPVTALWTGSNNCTTALTIANSYSNQYQALLFIVQVAYTSSVNHLVTAVVPKSVLATTNKIFVFESSGVATHLAIKYSGTSIIVSQNAYLSRGGSLVGVYGLS